MVGGGGKNVKIKTLEQLVSAANNGLSVSVCFSDGERFRMPRPAAFIIGMPARSVYFILRRGVYTYTAKQYRK